VLKMLGKSTFVRRSRLRTCRETVARLQLINEKQREVLKKESPRWGDFDINVQNRHGEWWCDVYRYDYKSVSSYSTSEYEYMGRQTERNFIKSFGPFKTQVKAIKAGHKYVYKWRVHGHISKADRKVNDLYETTVTV